MVSMTQRNFVAAAGRRLRAQRRDRLRPGPARPDRALGTGRGSADRPGKQGREGAEGPSGAAEIGGLEGEVEDLRGRVEEGEELEGRVEDLEAEISGLSGSRSALCEELELPC